MVVFSFIFSSVLSVSCFFVYFSCYYSHFSALQVLASPSSLELSRLCSSSLSFLIPPYSLNRLEQRVCISVSVCVSHKCVSATPPTHPWLGPHPCRTHKENQLEGRASVRFHLARKALRSTRYSQAGDSSLTFSR